MFALNRRGISRFRRDREATLTFTERATVYLQPTHSRTKPVPLLRNSFTSEVCHKKGKKKTYRKGNEKECLPIVYKTAHYK